MAVAIAVAAAFTEAVGTKMAIVGAIGVASATAVSTTTVGMSAPGARIVYGTSTGARTGAITVAVAKTVAKIVVRYHLVSLLSRGLKS